jgi:predicted ribosome quality control (RQC) complex YloA/Tae2 family protein
MRQRPKIFLDIKPKNIRDVFTARDKRINLNYSPRIKIPEYIFQVIAIVFVVSIFFSSSAIAPVSNDLFASVDSERAALEAELEELEEQITEYEKTISVYKQQGASLQGEISVLEAKIGKINLQIKAIILSLEKLNAFCAYPESLRGGPARAYGNSFTEPKTLGFFREH